MGYVTMESQRLRVSDAHFHFNMKINDPVEDMVGILENQLEKMVLILNTIEEANAFMQNFARLQMYVERIHVVVLMDINNMSFFEKTVSFLEERKILYSIKLHPRLTGIVKEEFEIIARKMTKCSFQNIVIDTFFYGSNLSHQTGVELAIYLAKIFTQKRIIVAHFGGVKMLETMLYTREVSNIYYDISFTLNYFKHTSIWKDVFYCIKMNENRVMFGTDYPAFHVSDTLTCVKQLFAENDGEGQLLRKLLSENVEKIYFGG